MSDRFVLIGHPVGHSVSPAIHAAAYRHLGRSASYALADCPDEAAVLAQVSALRRGELQGANVTVPWKHLAYELADERAQTAQDVGVANVLTRTVDGRVVAHNTDALALGSELARAVAVSGVDRVNRPCALVIGSGGAALAAVVGCRLAGVSQIFVTARRFSADQPEASWPHAMKWAELGAGMLPWPSAGASIEVEFLRRTQLIVQATSAGMKGTLGGEDVAGLVPWREVAPLVAYDLVYNPPLTPFLKRAGEHGHFSVGGLGMLVGQAAHAIGIWWGEIPDQNPLMASAREALGL